MGRFQQALHQMAKNVPTDPQVIRDIEARAEAFTLPPKTVLRGYKVFQTKKTQPGKIFPLFINAQQEVPQGVWIPAEMNAKGKSLGFAERPGWHIGSKIETHLDLNGTGRVWAEVEYPGDVDWQPVADASPTGDIKGRVPTGGFYVYLYNGKPWIIAGAIKVVRVLTEDEAGAETSNFAGRTKRKKAE